jgi:putative heme-binding domain-containing protein
LFALDPGANDAVGLVEVFVQRDRGANTLAVALKEQPVHDAVREAVAERVRRAGPLPGRLAGKFAVDAPRSLEAALQRENRARLVADVDEKGDPVRGEQIYRRTAIACTSCHAIGGAGPKLGPDLAAVGSASSTEYVVESILEPNKAIAEHYENTSVVTADGMFRMGVITFKSDTEISLRQMAMGEVRIPRNQIKKMTPMPSLMPAGLSDQLASRQEFLDLAHFVSRLGRPGPYANSDAPVVRTWQTAVGAKVYSQVNGILPAQELQPLLTTLINVQKAGEALLDINDPTGLRLRIDGKDIADVSNPIVLPAGQVVLQFAIDAKVRGAIGLRVELKNLPGSEARFRTVND